MHAHGESARQPDENILPAPVDSLDRVASGERFHFHRVLRRSYPPPLEVGRDQRGADRLLTQLAADGFDFG
jgi:hypothetical protein